MRAWPLQDAKARFSALLDACVAAGPQLVTRRGAEAAVLVPSEQWRRIEAERLLTLKEWLLADSPRGDLDIPPRGSALWAGTNCVMR